MQFPLNTHIRPWRLADAPLLSKPARAALTKTDNGVLVSAASAWEISTKFRLGKLSTGADLVEDVEGCLEREGFPLLPITTAHAVWAGLLPGAHRDPFGRMLIAQALDLNVALVSKEAVFDRYGVRRIW
ncbi:MAG: type II toxin-antitoxin system VapC family toxin [Bryobacterales bacterium]|jgi:PIN domain nuclease of toxin-antitoxin system|nr:type II toxin-antitoxin system VapC family toxin [Bryobacterales bacterium]